MKPKTLMLLAVAGGCGLLAMLGIQQAMQGGQSEAVPKVSVLVAKVEIQPGVELNDENVGFKELPVDSVSEDAVTSFEQYDGRALMFVALPGDIIGERKLGKKGEFTKSRQIREGWRVVSIGVNDTQTLSGMLRPGDRVDVLVTYQARNDRGVMTTKTTTLLEYIEVFAIDDKTIADGASSNGKQAVKTKVVSVVVTPNQVNFIKLAESKGTLALSWRHPDDDADVPEGEYDTSLFDELAGTAKFDGADSPKYSRTSNKRPLYDGESVAEPEHEPEAKEILDKLDDEAASATRKTQQDAWSLTIYNGDTPQTVSVPIAAEQSRGPESAGSIEGAHEESDGSLSNFFRSLHQQFTSDRKSQDDQFPAAERAEQDEPSTATPETTESTESAKTTESGTDKPTL